MPYPQDPHMTSQLYALLDATWPGLADKIIQARRWGSHWEWTSQPFTRSVDGEVAALVGVIELPLRIAGKDVAVAGIHGVCTAAPHRRKGLMGAALQEALAWVDQRWPAALLWTDQPHVYESAGFRVVQEHIWSGSLSSFAGAGQLATNTTHNGEGPQTLDLTNPEHLQTLRTHLLHRVPVSQVLGTRDPGWLALIDLALMGRERPVLWWIPALRCVVALELPTPNAPTLKILDVIAPHIPSLETLLEWLPCEGAQALELWCNLDLLPPCLTPTPNPWPDLLMVRNASAIGLDSARLEPFAFSVLTHC